MKISASGPAPSRARLHQRRGLADFAGLVVAQALERERPALERGEAAAHRFARAVERLLGRVGALQPVARVAAQPRAERAAEQPRDRHAEPLAFEVPQRDVERGQRGLRAPRRRASATRDRAGASAARARRDPGRSGAARIRGSPSRPTRARRAASPRPSRETPSSVSMRTNSQLHQSTQNLNVSIRVIFIAVRCLGSSSVRTRRPDGRRY